MNGIRKQIGTGLSRQGAFASRLFRGVFTTIAIGCLAVGTTSAHASCSLSGSMGSLSGIKLPLLQSEAAAATTSPTIVGLWGVIYTAADSSVFNQTFDQWHSDGTEFENAFVPLNGGNVCEGVWKTIGTNMVRLHHIGWTYSATPGTVADGTFTIDETNTVAANNGSYTGSFTYKVFDMKGSLLKTVSGTVAAVRITVE